MADRPTPAAATGPDPVPARPPAPGPRPPSPVPRGPEPAGHRPEPGGHRQRRQTIGRSGSGGGSGYGSDDRDTDRGLRGLVGSGTSQVNPATALRARDASRPGEDDLAAAEATLTIVRRHWVPREDLPRR
ncbi:hypothetical protein [Solwaraspora sp. WMMD791]|uniref:hypothetical protein n=1 Tax=Solwaraspora sp. WMMD791 TaxID=3016086 RepID=UPI0032B4D9DB